MHDTGNQSTVEITRNSYEILVEMAGRPAVKVEMPAPVQVDVTAIAQQGTQGAPGTDGVDGTDGLSAYEVALSNGFSGTEAQWLASLVGEQGIPGMPGETGAPGTGAPLTESITVAAPIATAHTLSQTPDPNSVHLFLNGLRESNQNFSIAGNTVNFPALTLAVGDLITFDYKYGA